jgi:hypothetical protein
VRSEVLGTSSDAIDGKWDVAKVMKLAAEGVDIAKALDEPQRRNLFRREFEKVRRLAEPLACARGPCPPAPAPLPGTTRQARTPHWRLQSIKALCAACLIGWRPTHHRGLCGLHCHISSPLPPIPRRHTHPDIPPTPDTPLCACRSRWPPALAPLMPSSCSRRCPRRSLWMTGGWGGP